MPTNRAGDKTATQGPSAKPEPEGTITQALPADGDPPNASTYAQAYKVVADFIDFLLKIQAKASAWAQWIWSTRTSAGHKRFTVDHFGFPMGRLVAVTEDWGSGVSISGYSSTNDLVSGRGAVDICGRPLKLGSNLINDLTTAGSNLSTAGTNVGTTATALSTAGSAADFATAKTSLSSAGTALSTAATAISAAGAAITDALTYLVSVQGASAWKAHTVGTASGITFFAPDNGVVQTRHRWAGLAAGDTSSDYTLIYRSVPCKYDNDLHLALEWSAQLEDTAMGSKLTTTMGLCDEDAIPASAGGAAADYVVFEKGPGGGNWFVRYRSGGGTAQGFDTGVAPTLNWTRFRIELHGSNVADDATRALRCYINGTQVGSAITTNIPVTTAKAAPSFAVVNTSGGAAGLSVALRLGPVRFAHNLFGSDVV